MMFKVGDRIELVAMPDDPSPIEPGTQGVIREVNPVDFGQGQRFTQLWVDWDNGRSLSPCVPPDIVKVVSRADPSADPA